jgi:hypothetical protein
VGARSSSSENPQLPQQQQQRAPGKTRYIQLGEKKGFEPVDWLDYESLTESTKKKCCNNFVCALFMVGLEHMQKGAVQFIEEP